MYNNDYFSKKMGFVIDDMQFETKEAAYAYLRDTCCMEEEDCDSFLRRLVREYAARVRGSLRKGAM